MAISSVASGYDVTGSNYTIALTVATNDFIIVVVAGATGGAITAPAGWTALNSTITTEGIQIFTHIVPAGESGSYLFSGSSPGGLIVSWSQYRSSLGFLQISASTSTVNTALATSIALSAINSNSSSDWYVLAVGLGNDSSATAVPASSPSLAARVSYADTNSTWPTTSINDTNGPVSATGAQPTYSFTFAQSVYAVAAGVVLSEASAPNAPTLTTPANGAYIDATIAGNNTFSATYNSTDNANANARAMRIKASSASSYNYLNVSTNALQSTIVWNTVNIAPGASGSFTVPGLSNGVTDNWSMFDQESLANLQGPAAADFSVNFQLAPNLSINSPTGSETTTNSPSLSYTPTPASGASTTGGRWLIYPLATTQASGFSINIGAGTIPAGAVSDVSWTGNPLTVAIQSGVTLTNGAGYVAYAAVTETGNEWSSTISSSFTISLDQPAVATVTAVASIDTATAPPLVTITVQAHDNILSADDASFEGGIGTWGGGSNWTISQDSTHHLDGSYALKCLRNSATSGNGYAVSGEYVVEPSTQYTALMSIYADSTSAGLEYKIRVEDATSGVDLQDLTVTPALGWNTYPIVFSTAATTQKIEIWVVDDPQTAPASGQEIWVDQVGIFPGNLGYMLEVLSDDPVAYWPLSDAAGSTSVIDATGNGFAASLSSGVTLGEPGVVVQFPSETSANFNGAAQGATSASVPLDLLTYGITFEAWIKPNAYPASGDNALIVGIYPSLGISMAPNGAAQGWLNGTANPYGNVPLAQWTHIAVVYSANSTSRTIYINGVAVGTETDGSVTNLTGAVYLGGQTSYGAYPVQFNGEIAHAAIYDSALSSSRIQAHYNSALATGSLVEKWTRGGLVGSTVASVLRSDGLYVRGAYASAPAAIPTPSQTLVVTDYEVTPGEAYTYTAVVSDTLSANAVISSPQSAASASVQTSATSWWMIDPLNPQNAISLFVTAHSTAPTEKSTAHFTVGEDYPTIVASTMGGNDGSITVQTVTTAEFKALKAVMSSQKIQWLISPIGDGLWVRVGPQPGGMSSGMGNQTRQSRLTGPDSANPVQTTQVTYNQVNRP